jgi:hypothetical protein
MSEGYAAGDARTGEPSYAPVDNGGGYPGACGGGPVAARNGLGTAALVLGILALVTCWTVIGGVVLGVLAVIFGLIGRGRVKRGEATNGGSALAGIITGALGILAAAALIAVGVSILNSPAGKNLQSCLSSAGSNSAAQQSCQDQYRQQVGK